MYGFKYESPKWGNSQLLELMMDLFKWVLQPVDVMSTTKCNQLKPQALPYLGFKSLCIWFSCICSMLNGLIGFNILQIDCC